MRAFVGLGSNVGARLAFLRAGAAELERRAGALRCSPVYETEAMGPPQPDFLNAAVCLETAPGITTPEALLRELLAIETRLGRVRPDDDDRHGPRPLDLDLLLLWDDSGGEVVLETPLLTVPHPRLHQRTFALLPLVALDPGLVHPLLRLPLREILRPLLLAGRAPRVVGPLRT